MNYIGEVAALGVVFSWGICTLLFEYSSQRIGSTAINFIKLSSTFIFIGIYLYFQTDNFWALKATDEVWLWIGTSGLIGFALCDQALLTSYRLIGARFTQLIMTSYPLFASITAYFILGETISLLGFIGMITIISGLAISILSRREDSKALQIKLPIKGVLLALFSALTQGVGFVLSKKGMMIYENNISNDVELIKLIPLASTQIRALTGFLGIVVIMVLGRKTYSVVSGSKDHKAVFVTFGGTIFGPLLGVTLLLFALRNANTGVVSTIVATLPIVLLIYEVASRRKKILVQDIIGTLLAVIGVALFFI